MDDSVTMYTHNEYRNARVVHLTKQNRQVEFFYHGKQISQEEANNLTNHYYKVKNRKIEENDDEGKE